MVKRVEVSWVDSWNLASGWHDLDEKPDDWIDDLPRQRTSGYLVRKTKRTLVIASSINADGKYAAIVAIPRVSILSVRRL